MQKNRKIYISSQQFMPSIEIKSSGLRNNIWLIYLNVGKIHQHLLNKTYLCEFQVHKNHPIRVLVSLPPEHTLNADAPNSWKLESKSQGLVKGQVPETLRFDINEQSDDFFTLILKLYLCSNGICTVRSTKIVFQTDENARDTGDNEIQIKV